MGLKVLVCHPGPQYSVADVHSKIVKGLRDNGCEVGDLNLDRYLDFFCASHVDRGNGLERFVSYEDACRMACDYAIDHACYTFWPDVVIIVSGFFVPPEKYRLLRAHGHHLVLWCTESPYEDDRQLAMAQFADTVILNDPQNINEFKQKNRRTFYIPHSYDPDIHHPGPFSQEHASDFFFVGTGYPSRMEFFENVDWDGIDVALAGNWKEAAGTPLEEMAVLIRLNARSVDFEEAFSDAEIPFQGAALLSRDAAVSRPLVSIMYNAAGTPLPETSATAIPSRPSGRGKKS